MPPIDFPMTPTTWIDDAVEHKRCRELRDHFLGTYREPLLALIRLHAPGLSHDAEEIVHSFLIRTFGSSPDAAVRFAARARLSGFRLRRYIANGLLFHTRGIMRDRHRGATRTAPLPPDAFDTQMALTPAADEAFERAWAQSVVRDACTRVESLLQGSGRGRSDVAWDVFRRHTIDGRRYSDLTAEFGLEEQQMADLVRRVVRLLRREITNTLELEGIPAPQVEAELERLLARLWD